MARPRSLTPIKHVFPTLPEIAAAEQPKPPPSIPADAFTAWDSLMYAIGFTSRDGAAKAVKSAGMFHRAVSRNGR